MKKILTLLIIAFPLLANAQYNFKKGSLTLPDHEKIQGSIDLREGQLNPTIVNFQAADGSIKLYTPETCLSYDIEGYEKYESYKIPITLSKIKVIELSNGIDTSTKTEAIFLRLLSEGKNVKLYSYRDNLKMRFFIKEAKDAVPYELIRQIYLSAGSNGIAETKKTYLKQLSDLISKYAANESKNIERVGYYQKEIAKVVQLINGAGNQEVTVVNKAPGSRFFAGIGLNVNKLDFVAAQSPGKKIPNDAVFAPTLAVGIDFLINPAIGRLIFRTEASVYTSDHSIDAYNEDEIYPRAHHSFKQASFVISPQFLYNFYNTQKLKVYGTAGFALHLSKFSSISTESLTPGFQPMRTEGGNNLSLRELLIAYPISAGVCLNNKFQLYLGYTAPVSVTGGVANYKINVARYKLGVNYLFGKAN